jgi:hypothetical protein
MLDLEVHFKVYDARMKTLLLTFVTTTVLVIAPAGQTAQHPAMPPGMSHEEHLAQMQKEAEMKKRGTAAMGFDQDRVAHHFVLTPQGGTIQVDVTDGSDEKNLQAIRVHLRQIAEAFARGDFDAPFVTHGEVPPGVPTLKRLKSAVTYMFEETPGGGGVRMLSDDMEALAAIHEFLRYQIREHHTGDPEQLR